ncbi:MAG: DUF1460 domain-containing protein [Bacteroidetes bacterium]|nr:DUF1460 domain-containing protein [Bacteroidota bacterium]
MNRRNFLKYFSAIYFLPSLYTGDKTDTAEILYDIDELICKKIFDNARSTCLADKPINEIIVEIAGSFIGTDYSAGTLEVPGDERLVVNLQAFDCVTFYENSLVLARCIKKNKMTFEDFKKELQFVRYRGGIIDRYPSRLHYTSDYFHDNEKKGVLKNISKEIGGVRFKKKINFISGHAESYIKLKENPEFINVIAGQEKEISRRTMYCIPKSKIKKFSSRIKNGDIIGITTNIKGLDCTHTGIAVFQNNKLHMMHAPIPGSKVQITDVPLWEYLSRIKKDTGIIVARAMEPGLPETR